MTIHYRQQGSAIIVFGNTYPFRERIKALGGRFEGTGKTWRIPLSDTSLTLIAELCQGAGGGALGEAPVTASARALVSEVDLSLDSSGVTVRTSTSVLSGPSERSAAVFGAPDSGLSTPDAAASLTIRQLMERVGYAVSAAFPLAVWVTGEVQNLSQRPSGVFFDLAEAREGSHASSTVTVRSIIWGGTLAAIGERRGRERLSEVLQDGMQIRCLCQVQLYKDRGSVTLLIEDIDPAFTKGALALAREKLLKELRGKGLDQAQKRLALTPFPFTVGLISADNSRAKSDFLDQLWTLGFPGEVFFCATPMQGESVPVQVVRAIRTLVAKGVDLVVVTRGGGSAADLRWFDAPEIAYAIAASPVPIVAAIGHHEDVSVAEEICFLRQKTPTAAADFVAGRFVLTREVIDGHAGALAKTLERRVEEFSLTTAALSERLASTATQALSGRASTLQARSHALQRGLSDRTHQAGTQLAQALTALQRSASERLHTLESQLTQTAGALQRATGEQAHQAACAVALLTQALGRAAERTLAAEATRLSELGGLLGRADPRPWLEQGWTRLCGDSGAVTTTTQTRLGEILKARLKDGWLALTVTDKGQSSGPDLSGLKDSCDE